MSQYVRTTLTYGMLELSPLLTLRMQIYQQCMQQALFFSLFLDSLLKITYSEFLRLMAEELQTLQAKGLIFLIIFGFFVKNHLLANTKSSFYDLQFESYNLCRQQTLFFSLFLDSLLKITY